MESVTYIASNEKGKFFFSDSFTYIASNSGANNQPDEGNAKKDIFLPLHIFRNGLSGLEAISKYLKELKDLKYCEIARLLNRDDRTIWGAYQSAKQKSNETFSDSPSNIHVPLGIFNNRSLSILENLSSYLKEEFNLRYCQIASFLNKDARTIWTACNRANKKRIKCS